MKPQIIAEIEPFFILLKEAKTELAKVNAERTAALEALANSSARKDWYGSYAIKILDSINGFQIKESNTRRVHTSKPFLG